MNNVVVIADDFTGAGDSGVHFARSGVRTAFLLNTEDIPHVFTDHGAVVLSTESRFMQPQAASEVIAAITLRCRNAGGGFFYKKVDSALRGNPGVETAGMLRSLKYPAALICPALPLAGRSCVNGVLLLNGRPVHTTTLGQDPFTPVLTSSVADCFARQADFRPGFISLEDIAAGQDSLRRKARDLLAQGCAALVADATTDADLNALGELVRYACDSKTDFPPLLPVGSGGLARAIAGAPRLGAARPQGRLLAVVGSLNGSALEQAAFACDENAYSSIIVDIEAGLANPDEECLRLVRTAATSGNKHILLRGREDSPKHLLSTDEGSRVAVLYGRAVYALCSSLPFVSVFATGGSTAVAVAAALGLGSVTLEDELSPGVVVSSCHSPHTDVRWFISKAGNFGNRETLVTIAAATQ